MNSSERAGDLDSLLELALQLWPFPKTRSVASARHLLAGLLAIGSRDEVAAYLKAFKKEADSDKLGYPLAVACKPDGFRIWQKRRRKAAVDAKRHDATQQATPDARVRSAVLPPDLASVLETLRSAGRPQAPVRTLPGPEAQPTTKTRLRGA